VDSGYLQEQLGEGRVRFTVTPAPVPATHGIPLAMAILSALLVIATMPARPSPSAILVRLVIAVLGGEAVRRRARAWLTGGIDRARAPGGSFVVSPAAIEAMGGATIPRDRLRRLIVRNGVPALGETAAVDAGVTYRGAKAPGEVAQSRTKTASVSYMLCAEYGAQSATLAGGMTEGIALGLLTDVSRILSVA